MGHLTIELQGNFLPVLYPHLIETMGLSFAQIGVAAFALGAAVTLPQPLFGYLSHRWAPATTIVVAPLWIGLFMGLVGLAPSYVALLALVVLGGLGSAVFHPAGSITASLASADSTDSTDSSGPDHPGRRRGAAMSLFSVGGNLGAALSPLLVAAAVAIWSPRATLSMVVLGIPAAAALHQFAIRGPLQVRRPLPSSGPAGGGRGIPVAVLVIMLVTMTRAWFQMSLITYLPTWVQSAGGSAADGAAMLFALAGPIGAGSLAGGWLSDRFGRWQVLLVALLLLAPAHLGFIYATGLPRILLAAVTGVLLGTTFPVAIVLAQEAWPQQIGLASGLVMGLGWLPGGLGASFTGVLADRIGLTAALSWVGVAPVVGAAALAVFLLGRRRLQHWTATG